jgi:hypothetical protein
MKNVNELKSLFDRLNITEDNIDLFESLLIQDASEFIPLMTEILDGRVDIGDLRSFFNKYTEDRVILPNKSLPLFLNNTNLVTSTVDSLKNSLFSDNPIKEGFLPTDDTDLKYAIAAKLKNEQNIDLTDLEINSIVTGKESFKIISTDFSRSMNKEEQLTNSNLLSPKIDGVL